MNLDTSAGEACVDAASSAVFDTTGQHMDDPPGGWVCLAVARAALSAALSATVECAACGGSGERLGSLTVRRYPQTGIIKRMVACPRCDGTGRRLAIKEMLDE